MGTYDRLNRLKTASGATYDYAPDNKRVWKKKPDGSQEFYFYLGNQRLGTYSHTNGTYTGTFATLSTNTYFGGKMLSAQGSTILTDRLGSNVTSGKRYFPWGQEQPSATTNDTEKFTGYFRDAESGLDYADRRYHNPGSGRFITPDPAWDGLNWYSFVGGDPVNNIDPSGLFVSPVTVTSVGTLPTTPDGTLTCRSSSYDVVMAGLSIMEWMAFWMNNNCFNPGAVSTGEGGGGAGGVGGSPSTTSPTATNGSSGLLENFANAASVFMNWFSSTTITTPEIYSSASPSQGTSTAPGCPPTMEICSHPSTGAPIPNWGANMNLGTAVGPLLAVASWGTSAVLSPLAIASSSTVPAGTTVYRVFGGEASPFGEFWTTQNPLTIPNYRIAAGLFPSNSGEYVIRGTLTGAMRVGTAAAGPTGVRATVNELIIPNAVNQVKTNMVFIPKPPL